MQPSDMPETVRGVMSFDFDGTLHCPQSEPVLDPVFFEQMQQLREQGWVWGVNTGRSQMQFLDGMMEARFPFLPDFLIARERELYAPGKCGRFVPLTDWNKKCEKAHAKMYQKSKKILARIKDYVVSETNARWVSEEGDPAGLVASSLEEMEEILAFVAEACGQHKDLGYLHNGVYLRFSHSAYHKGTTLREVCSRFGVTTEMTLAMGDGANDLGMLQRDFAQMIACPSNAVSCVKAQVSEQGGYVCQLRASHGVVEAVKHFLM